MNKRGLVNMKSGILGAAIAGIILVVLLFQVFAVLLPEFQHAGNNISATGAPLTALFSGSGIMTLLLVAALILAVVAAFGFGGGRR